MRLLTIRKQIGLGIFTLLFAGSFVGWFGAGAARAEENAPAASLVSAASENFISWRQLTWEDFRVDDTQNGRAAETVSFLRFRYRAHVDSVKNRSGETYTATISQITFLGGFNKVQSWRRSKVAEPEATLLRHEQGHLNLNEIKRRQLQLLLLQSFPIGHGATLSEALNDLSQKMGDWFRGEVFALKTRQVRYDDETCHGTLAKRQSEWNEQIDREIAALPAL